MIDTILGEKMDFEKIWANIRQEAEESKEKSKFMKNPLDDFILFQENYKSALSNLFAHKLSGQGFLPYSDLISIAGDTLGNNKKILEHSVRDISAFFQRDPACTKYMEPFLFYKGFIALQAYRIARDRYLSGEIELGKFIQMRVSELFGVDLHPNADIGSGLMIDHAHSIVVGATAVIGQDVSMLHSVTLGGTGKETGDRHPKIGNGVLLGAGCSILGNISIGYCSKVASGSVVLDDVPPCKTVAGVPAKIVGESGCENPSHEMDHSIP